MSRAEKIIFQKKKNLSHFDLQPWLAPKQKSGKIWNILVPSYWDENYLIWKTLHKDACWPNTSYDKVGQEDKSNKYA